jgi:hypothetical protein
MSNRVLLTALALPMLLVPLAGRAEPRDLLDPTGRAYAGQVLPAAEIDARRGWRVYSQIDDARDALARDRRDTAQHLIARARADLVALRRADTPDPSAGPARAPRTVGRDAADVALPSARVDGQLAQAQAALAAGDRAGADRWLAEAGGGLRTALVRFDDRHQPAAVATAPGGRASRDTSYGSSGISPPLENSRFGAPGGVTGGSGPNSTPGAYGLGTTGPGTAGSAIPGYGMTGGQPGSRR